MVTQVDNDGIASALSSGEAQVAAGTGWLWARSEMAASVDVLFIDEAGQMSLTNVLAVSQAATSSVLLGDPQQLDQPQKGIHPPGAEGSAFDHLLQGHATIGSDQGLFLTETQRLDPEICAFTSELFLMGGWCLVLKTSASALTLTARSTALASGSFRSFTVDFFQKWAHGLSAPGCTFQTRSQ